MSLNDLILRFTYLRFIAKFVTQYRARLRVYKFLFRVTKSGKLIVRRKYKRIRVIAYQTHQKLTYNSHVRCNPIHLNHTVKNKTIST